MRDAAFGEAMATLEEEPPITQESDWLERSLRLARQFDFLPKSPLKQPLTIPDIETKIHILCSGGR